MLLFTVVDGWWEGWPDGELVGVCGLGVVLKT
jgi:hypothetical protein